ncbi:MAG: hypothetical protein PHC75_06150 [Burkholderiales bacterium]|nr:hypothetical protein [Burkholderiales bacterium]
MKINGISGSAIGGVRRQTIEHSNSAKTNGSGSPLMNDTLSFKNIKFEEYSSKGVATCSELKDVLYRMFLDILNSGIAIVAVYRRDYGSYVMEASFKAMDNTQKMHQINLPLRGVTVGDSFSASGSGYTLASNKTKKTVDELTDRIINASSENDVRRLIIVTAHEYGHFLSWQIGNHNQELKNGLQLIQQKMARSNFNFAEAVYREEMLAWNLGLNKLLTYGFEFIAAYEKLKKDSLDTYYKELQLKDAPIDIHSKMSLYL